MEKCGKHLHLKAVISKRKQIFVTIPKKKISKRVYEDILKSKKLKVGLFD